MIVTSEEEPRLDEVERLRREIFDYETREKLWNESALMKSNVDWFREARQAYAEAAEAKAQLQEMTIAFKAQLHKAQGLWYGACAARTELRMELAALRRDRDLILIRAQRLDEALRAVPCRCEVRPDDDLNDMSRHEPLCSWRLSAEIP